MSWFSVVSIVSLKFPLLWALAHTIIINNLGLSESRLSRNYFSYNNSRNQNMKQYFPVALVLAFIIGLGEYVL